MTDPQRRSITARDGLLTVLFAVGAGLLCYVVVRLAGVRGDTAAGSGAVLTVVVVGAIFTARLRKKTG